MTARRTLALFRLWAVVLLATIGLQAMAPVHAPLQREAGSAFSASTSDVALASARRGDVAKVAAVPTPLLARAVPEAHLAASAGSFLPPDRLRPPARGPPPRQRPERLPDLRGPPLT